MKICSKMRYYNNGLAIFKDSPEILNNRYNPVRDLPEISRGGGGGGNFKFGFGN